MADSSADKFLDSNGAEVGAGPVQFGGGLDASQDGSGVTQAIIKAGGVTPAMTAQAVAVTGTTDGTGTGVISAAAKHVSVTSSASTKVVTLPAPVIGKVLTIDVGANGFKLQTTAPATIGINGGTGASAVSAIAANSTLYMICVSLTSWKGFFMDADSDVAKVPAAA